MDLVFIRHGKAQERSETQPDDTRSLTDAGRAMLWQTLPALNQLLCTKASLHLLSSPLVRALQTAEILSQVLQIDAIKQQEFLADGRLDKLIRMVSDSDSINPDSETTLLLVGHEPYLSNWCKQLCGQRLPFKKGAAACIRVKNRDFRRAELVWFLQPSALATLINQ